VIPFGTGSTADSYADFGEHQARSSDCYSAWGTAVSRDADVLARIETLPAEKRQPNLVFAAARWHGVPPGPYAGLRAALLGDWAAIRETVLTRSTQTNEVGRCATLLPLLAGLPGPLALLEVGASAGLCLYPDRYSYRYSTGVALDPADGPSPVVLECAVDGDVPLPSRLPEVAWRGGIDLNPLDVRDEDAMAWLQTLVWPGHEDRRRRLAAAVELVRRDPPPLVRGDLNADLPGLLSQVPDDLTLVVFHSAVLAYLPEPERATFTRTMRSTPGHWIVNESPTVLPEVAATASASPPSGSVVGEVPFVLGRDGRAVAWTEGHGRGLWWLGPTDAVSQATGAG
jgi:hypothetical protein